MKWAFLALCMMAALVSFAGAENNGTEVQILFTHDLHSHLDDYVIAGERVGGIARLKTLADEKRGEEEATLFVDSGDFSMGTLYQTIFETDAVELSMLGYLGVDATTFGNHEFDYRSEGVANMLDAALRNAERDPELTLPRLLISNIDWTKHTSDDNLLIRNALERYGSTSCAVFERGGVKFGVFGVVGVDAESCAPESGIDFDDIADAAREQVKLLKAQNVDIIVCLSHSGVWADMDQSEDEQLAMAVPEIDVIVSGHTHTTLLEPIRHGDTYVVSCGEYGQNLGELDLRCREDGRWEPVRYSIVPADDTVAPDAELSARLDQYREKINTEYLVNFGYTYDQVLAFNEIPFKQFSAFGQGLGGEPLGSIIADAYRFAVREAEGEDYEYVAAAVAPMGTIRDTLQTGELTVWDAFNVCSLGIGKDKIVGYPLVSVYLTGAEIRTAAEIDISVSPIMGAARLYPSGVVWTYNPNRLILDRVTDVKLVTEDGSLAELEDDKLYRAVVGLYAAQMLGAVEDVSYGILSIVPKDKNGVPIENYEDHIVYDREGNEVKEWYALASYLESFEKNEDGVSVVPASYSEPDERKICDDSTNLFDLLKNPGSIARVIYAVIIAVVTAVVLIAVLLIRKRRRKHR